MLFVLRYTIFLHLNSSSLIFSLRGFKFGEAVALYFAFLYSYTRALFFISVVGLAIFCLGYAYSSLYSSLLFLWSLVFVEYWRIRERLYSAAWGSLGSVRVEHHRTRYAEGHPWWKRELKILVSAPVIALFATILAILLTAIFVFEAFVTALYTGPGHQYIVSSSWQGFVSGSLTFRISPVVRPNCHIYYSHTSLSGNLSGSRAKANTMGEP